eukprot:scaffold94401_cov33-Tisochrysis_lutea.AAC.1
MIEARRRVEDFSTDACLQRTQRVSVVCLTLKGSGRYLCHRIPHGFPYKGAAVGEAVQTEWCALWRSLQQLERCVQRIEARREQFRASAYYHVGAFSVCPHSRRSCGRVELCVLSELCVAASEPAKEKDNGARRTRSRKSRGREGCHTARQNVLPRGIDGKAERGNRTDGGAALSRQPAAFPPECRQEF